MFGIPWVLLIVSMVCCGGARATHAHPNDSLSAADVQGAGMSVEQSVATSKPAKLAAAFPLAPAGHGQALDAAKPDPFASKATAVFPGDVAHASAKWLDLQSRILAEQSKLAGCQSGDNACPAAAERYLSIVQLAQQREGRARLGEINRAVNLSVRPVSDWTQYGVDDFWSSPLATLDVGAGDCEDYAIVKYAALSDAGIAPDDLRIVIVRDVKHQTNHAVVAVRHDRKWLILDNRTMVMADAEDVGYYQPLLVLDYRGARAVATASAQP